MQTAYTTLIALFNDLHHNNERPRAIQLKFRKRKNELFNHEVRGKTEFHHIVYGKLNGRECGEKSLLWSINDGLSIGTSLSILLVLPI